MTPTDTRQELLDIAQTADSFSPDAGPGLYLNVDEQAYFAHEGISRSTLATCARKSPLHAAYEMQSEDDQGSKSMSLGSALHARVLEPDTFDDRFDVAPDECSATLNSGDPCTYSAKHRHSGEWFCGRHAPDGEPDDIEVLKSDHFYSVQGMQEQLKRDPDARQLLYHLPGIAEATVIYRDDETGLLCKARPDRIACLPDEQVSIVDLKSTKSAHPSDFRRSYSRYGYWLQPAHYCVAVGRLPAPVEVVDFVFVCVESSRPYAVQCYRPASGDDTGARRRLAGLLEEMKDALEGDPTGYTPDGQSGVVELHMKRYEKDRLGISA